MTDSATETQSLNTPAIDAPRSAGGKVVIAASISGATEFIRVLCGFKPKYVKWMNADIASSFEWFEGMADNTCFKTLGSSGVITLETTNGGITVDDRGFRVLQNATLLAVSADDVCYWRAVA
jgi:hypothetical protein